MVLLLLTYISCEHTHIYDKKNVFTRFTFLHTTFNHLLKICKNIAKMLTFPRLTKENFLQFIIHFDLQMRKEEIKRKVARKLVEQEIIVCYNSNETPPQDNILLQIELEK